MREHEFQKVRVLDSEGHDGRGAQALLMFNKDGSPLNLESPLVEGPQGELIAPGPGGFVASAHGADFGNFSYAQLYSDGAIYAENDVEQTWAGLGPAGIFDAQVATTTDVFLVSRVKAEDNIRWAWRATGVSAGNGTDPTDVGFDYHSPGFFAIENPAETTETGHVYRSPNGTQHKVSVTNDGTMSVVPI
jgi:hypothetical protein